MALNFPSNPSENDIYQFGLLTYIFKNGKWVSQSRGASQLPWYSNELNHRAMWERLCAEAGLVLVAGSFEEGGTINATNEVLWWKTGASIFAWGTNEAKTVPANSTPATSGGIGAGAWVDRTDETLRSAINVVVKRFASVADMVADTSLQLGQVVETVSYYSGSNVGGNKYTIVNPATGSADGGSYINLSNNLQAKAIFENGIRFSQFGAIPADSTIWNDFNLPYEGTDSTSFIINCITFLQKVGTTYRDSYFLQPVGDLEGHTYIVTGDNPLGCHYPGLGNAGAAYYYKMQNGQFIWNRNTSTKLFSGFTKNNCKRFDLSNINIICAQNTTTSASIFKIGYDDDTPMVGGCVFDNTQIICGSYSNKTKNCTERVFDIAGKSMADRFTIRNCVINGWQYLYESSNPESVSFGFYDTDLITPRDGAIFFNHTCMWSGGLNIYGCDIIGMGDSITYFKSSNSSDANFSLPNIDIRSRFECRGNNCVFFNVDHGAYSVNGMNMTAGHKAGTVNTAVILGKSSVVSFKDSALFQIIDLGYFTTRGAGRLRRILVENCTFEASYPIVKYGGLTYRQLVSSGYNSGCLIIKNSQKTTNGIWGNGLENTEPTESSCRLCTIDPTGYTRLADISNVTKKLRLPSNVFITSAVVHCAPQPLPTMYVGIYINDNLVATVPTSTSSRLKKDAVTSAQWGIYCIGDCVVSAKVLDSTYTPVAQQFNIVAFVDLTYRPIGSTYEYSTADYGVI